jgi:hypothetical protein
MDSWYTLTVGSPPLIAESTLDTPRAVTQLVPRAGGTLQATAADGTKYVLTVPANALTADVSITMTPLATLAVPDLAAEGFAGVHLQPEGLTFVNPVTLAMTPKAGTTWAVAEQIPIGFRADNRVSLAYLDKTSANVKLFLEHFSSYALLFAKKGLDATLEPARHRLGGDAVERIQSAAAEQLGRERQKALLGDSEGGVFVGFEPLRDQYWNEVLKPRLAAAGESCANGRLALQTLLGFERQHALLGSEFKGYPTDSVTVLADTLAVTAKVCMKEEYEICHDEHIITRIVPAFLGLARQAALLGFSSSEPGEVPPVWLQQAEDYARRCLQFELRFDGSVSFSSVGFPKRSMFESVTSTVKISYGMAFVEPLPDSPAPILDLGALLTGPLTPMIASGYSVNLNEDCVTLDTKTSKNGQLGVSLMGFTPGEGSATERATVKDFGLSFAMVPNMSEYTFNQRTRDGAACVDPHSSTNYESFSTTGGALFLQDFTDGDSGAYATGWTIVGNGDIMATKDISLKGYVSSGDDSINTTIHMILFHKPL